MKKKKTKEIRLPTRFNPALQKYEPILPVKRKGKEIKFKDAWQWILIILICAVLLTGVILLIRSGLL